MVIAIDGPAGAGKSTVAKRVAERLGFLYVDTGAMYRALTLKAVESRIDINDTVRLIELANRTSIQLENSPEGALKVLLDGRDVSRQVRQPRVTRSVSEVARIKGVREAMLKLQRRLGMAQDSVLEGRDIGTVVFPDAQKKFYIDANSEERVRRRYKELKEMGNDIAISEVEVDLSKRDAIDSGREFAPLKKADDAVYIDTTDMTVDQVVEKVLTYIR